MADLDFEKENENSKLYFIQQYNELKRKYREIAFSKSISIFSYSGVVMGIMYATGYYYYTGVYSWFGLSYSMLPLDSSALWGKAVDLLLNSPLFIVVMILLSLWTIKDLLFKCSGYFVNAIHNWTIKWRIILIPKFITKMMASTSDTEVTEEWLTSLQGRWLMGDIASLHLKLRDQGQFELSSWSKLTLTVLVCCTSFIWANWTSPALIDIS